MMLSYIRIIRWPNLILLGLMLVLLRWALMEPILLAEDKGLLLTPVEYALLIISTMLIAAGGYVINDVEDIAIDRINRPQKMIAGATLTKEACYNFYLVLTACGLLLGGYLTFIKEIKYIIYIHAISAGMLYFYATAYKCIPLLGNLIISGLTALAVYLVILPEPFAKDDAVILTLVSAYAVFAFSLTLIRELTKDIEDHEGDAQCGCSTLAVKAGKKFTQFLAVIFTLLVLGGLIWIQYSSRQWETPLPFYYLVGCVDLPLLLLSIQLIRAKEKVDFSKASNLAKICMFTGVFSMYIFHLSFQ